MEIKDFVLEYYPAFQRDCARCAHKVECFDMDVLLRHKTASLAREAALPASPQVTHRYADRREICCRTACEHAIRLMAQFPGGLRMIEWKTSMPDGQTVENHTVVRYHRAVHKACVRILQNRVYPLAFRMQLLGIAVETLNEVATEDRALEWVMRYRYFWGFDERLSKQARRFEKERSSALRSILYVLSCENRNGSVYWNGFIPEILQSLQVQVPEDGRLMFSYTRYRTLARKFSERADAENLLENILVNALVEEGFPLEEANGEGWIRYLTLCLMYDLMKISAVVHMERYPSENELIRGLAASLRYFYYRKNIWMQLARQLAREEVCSGQAAAGLLRV